MKQTILKSLTRKSDQGKFWHQIDPESQKSQLIVMAIMDRLFWEIHDMTSTRQAGRETHIKCCSPFWENSRSGGAHQHTYSPWTVWSRQAGIAAYVPSSARKLDSTIEKYLAACKFIIMRVKCIFKIQYNPKTAACNFCRGKGGHVYLLIHIQMSPIHFLQISVFHFPLKFFIYYKNNSQKSRRQKALLVRPLRENHYYYS